MERILEFCSNLGLNLIETFGSFYDTLQTEFLLPGFGNITILETMFGVGFSTFVACTIAKWIIGIVQ